jgi:hypothetical protein
MAQIYERILLTGDAHYHMILAEPSEITRQRLLRNLEGVDSFQTHYPASDTGIIGR